MSGNLFFPDSGEFYLKIIAHKSDLKWQMAEFFGFTLYKSEFFVPVL